MLGSKIAPFVNSCIDISDGFIGDLSKLLKNNYGVNLIYSKVPFSQKTKKIIKNNKTDPFLLLNGGDDYELIFTSSSKYDYQIEQIANKYKFKITKVGKIIDKKGVFLDDKKFINSNNAFEYFF